MLTLLLAGALLADPAPIRVPPPPAPKIVVALDDTVMCVTMERVHLLPGDPEFVACVLEVLRNIARQHRGDAGPHLP
jgi:hypothetical protein